MPDIYSGPHLTFPLTVEQAVGLVEAFRHKKVGEHAAPLRISTAPEVFSELCLSQQQLHSRYVLQLLLETWKRLRMLPNINRVSTCHSKEITICGEAAAPQSLQKKGEGGSQWGILHFSKGPKNMVGP